MKNYVLIMFTALLMCSSSLNAQQKKSEQKQQQMIEADVASIVALGFDDEKGTLKILFENQLAEKKKLRKENDTKSDDFKTQMKALQKKYNDELKALIGKDKFKAYKKQKAKNKN